LDNPCDACTEGQILDVYFSGWGAYLLEFPWLQVYIFECTRTQGIAGHLVFDLPVEKRIQSTKVMTFGNCFFG
jgi:hypothetical protein